MRDLIFSEDDGTVELVVMCNECNSLLCIHGTDGELSKTDYRCENCGHGECVLPNNGVADLVARISKPAVPSGMDAERLRKVLLITLGTLTELRLMGHIAATGDAERLTADGMDEFIRLKASGFSPSAEEVGAAVALYRTYEPE